MVLSHALLTRGLPGRHTHFRDSPIGKIPAEWEVKRLGEFADVQAGMALGKNRRPQNQARPYLRVANVLMDRLDLTDIKLMEIPPHEYERRQLKECDVIETFFARFTRIPLSGRLFFIAPSFHDSRGLTKGTLSSCGPAQFPHRVVTADAQLAFALGIRGFPETGVGIPGLYRG